MQVNLHDTKTLLSRFVDQAVGRFRLNSRFLTSPYQTFSRSAVE